MKNTEIRSAIDAALSGYGLSSDQESTLLKHVPAAQKPKTGFPRKTVVAIICVLLLLALMVPAIGLPELQIFRKSTNDILAYQIEVNRPMPGVFVAETPSDDVSAVWGPEIAKALLDMNAVLHLPEWKPEGYINSVETTIETDVIWGGHIRQEFQDDDGNRIMLSVFVYPDDGNFGMTVHVQHDNTENETWKYGGIDYTYVNNLGVRSVSWSEGNCWTQIYGEPTRDELHKMIKSIYD